ncbi:MAG: helix-turn-helix domain-containing protein [Saprospiraceae bacterium]
MLWTSLFAISIAQGIFLLSLIFLQGAKNRLAVRLIALLVAFMVITNFGYLVIRTDLKNYIPQCFALPFGMMLLFGPLLYLYAKSVLDPAFRWKQGYWLHFLPYFLQLMLNAPLFTLPKVYWSEFINTFLSGELPIRFTEKIILALQHIQLLVYLILTFRWIQQAKRTFGNAQYLVPVSSRINWLEKLWYSLSLFLTTIFFLFLFILFNGKYNPITNYFYTLISSGIIYFIAYQLVLNPELISPDFIQKYRAYMSFSGEEGEQYLQKIKTLMQESKIFTDPDLKLPALAKQIGLPTHQLSKLINEKFGKSFTDFINEYRVQEFIIRMNDNQYKSYSLYGIALEVGFNSKSSFNAAFKRITGKTPSDYKIPV